MSPLFSVSQNSLISVGTHVSGPSPLLIWRAASWSWTIGKSHRRWVQDLGSYHITERGAGIPGRHRRAGSELIAILSLYCPPLILFLGLAVAILLESSLLTPPHLLSYPITQVLAEAHPAALSSLGGKNG